MNWDELGGILRRLFVKLTVWEIFFMLLTVIPVARMLYTIFMKLIVRIGTVDEEKWGAIGLGALGSMIGGAYMLSKIATGSLGRGPRFTGSLTGGATGTGGLSLGAATPTSIPGISARPVTGTGGPTGLDSAISAGAAGSSRAANYGAMFGIGTSFAAPQVAAPMAAIGAGIARAFTAPATTAFSIGKELIARTDYGRSRQQYASRLEALKASGGFRNLLKQSWEGVKDVTGAQTTSGAIAAITGAVVASPFGGTAARFTSHAMRTVGDFKSPNIVNTIDNLKGFWRN